MQSTVTLDFSYCSRSWCHTWKSFLPLRSGFLLSSLLPSTTEDVFYLSVPYPWPHYLICHCPELDGHITCLAGLSTLSLTVLADHPCLWLFSSCGRLPSLCAGQWGAPETSALSSTPTHFPCGPNTDPCPRHQDKRHSQLAPHKHIPLSMCPSYPT